MSSTQPSILQPKTLREILLAAWRNCIANSGAAFIAAAVVLLPAAVVMSFSEYVSVNLGIPDIQKQAQAGTLSPTSIDPMAFVMLGGYTLVMYLLMFFCTFFAAVAVGRIVAERTVGREIGPAAAWDFLMGAWWRLVLTAVLLGLVYVGILSICSAPVGIVSVVRQIGSGGQATGASPLIVGIAVVLVGVPMLILGTYLAPMATAAAVEDRGSAGTLIRSFRLVAGNFGRTFLAILIGSAIMAAPMTLLGVGGQKLLAESLKASLGEANAALVSAVPAVLAMLLVSPFMYALEAVIYFDLRARRDDEELTVADLALDLGHEPPSASFPDAELSAGGESSEL
jgi:hypothetical protein